MTRPLPPFLLVCLLAPLAHAQTPTPPPAPPATTTPPSNEAAGSPEPEAPVPLIDEDGEPKLSLPTEADRVAWSKPGFRLSLAAAYGSLQGLRGAPTGRLLGAKVRAGLRLDADWSVVTSFEYARASSDRDAELGGLRFMGTIDPTWHVTRSLSVAVGFGFGGIVESGRVRMTPEPSPDSLEASYTFPNARALIGSCSGVGVATLLRAEWAYVLGPRAAFTIAAEASGQWTGCIGDTGRVEPDTGEAIVQRQWWPHAGGTLAVGVTWR